MLIIMAKKFHFENSSIKNFYLAFLCRSQSRGFFQSCKPLGQGIVGVIMVKVFIRCFVCTDDNVIFSSLEISQNEEADL